MTKCLTLQGDWQEVPDEKLVFRPAAYAVIVRDGKMLLLRTKSTGKYWFPGGGIEVSESLPAGLNREVREETGLTVRITKLLHFEEVFFYYAPLDEAYHNFSFFYLCAYADGALLTDDAVDDLESASPRWVTLTELREDSFQPPAGKVFAKFIEQAKN